MVMAKNSHLVAVLFGLKVLSSYHFMIHDDTSLFISSFANESLISENLSFWTFFLLFGLTLYSGALFRVGIADMPGVSHFPS